MWAFLLGNSVHKFCWREDRGASMCEKREMGVTSRGPGGAGRLYLGGNVQFGRVESEQ